MDINSCRDLSKLQDQLKSSAFRVPALVALESLSPLRGLACGLMPACEPVWKMIHHDSYQTVQELLSSQDVYENFLSGLEDK